MGYHTGRLDRQRCRQFLLENLEDRRMLAGVITQVGYFDTWDGGVVRSTDVAGIAYHPPSGHLYLADSEINELPIFNGDNIFETSLSGDRVFREITSHNTEPTGIAYNEFDGYFYVTNDTGPKTVTRYDNNLNNPLLVISTKDDVSNATDPEGVTANPANGFLYVVDGSGGGRQVLTYNSNLVFQSVFSVANRMTDAEGIAYHAPSNHLLIVDGNQDKIFEYTLNGNFIEQYDITGFSPKPKSPQGLTFAPTSNPSDNPNNLSLYIADGMKDNFADGRVFEAVIGSGPPANHPPTTSGIANVNVNVNAPNTVIDLFAAFDDVEDPDPNLTYTIQNNTNSSLFTSTTINGVQGTLTLDYASATTGTANITVRATDTGTPPLFVNTTFSVTVTPGGQTPVTIEVRVAASSDDAEEKPTGGMRLTSSDLELTQDKGDPQIVGMRFTGINIPAGASIQNAYLQFQTDETTSDPTSLAIYGQAINNAPTFTATNGNISSRTKTSASATWSPAPWNTKGQAGPNQRTPNISAVIQEIVNRPGWSNGNALAIIVTGTGNRTGESFDGVSSAAPLLHVEYTLGQALHMANDRPQSSAAPPSVVPLDESQLARVVDAGIALLSQSGISTNALAGLNFAVVDLPNNMLGRTLPNAIQIDVDAAGFGWFVDSTPYDNSEFIFDSTTNRFVAPRYSPAHARVDLLTTVMHELGHVLGLEHTDSDGLMDAELSLGTRRFEDQLSSSDIDAFFERLGLDHRRQRTLVSAEPNHLFDHRI